MLAHLAKRRGRQLSKIYYDFMLNYFAAYHYQFVKRVFDEVRRKNALLKLTTNQLKQVTFPSRTSSAKLLRRNMFNGGSKRSIFVLPPQ